MKQILILKPKVSAIKAFNYTGFEDLANLIKFTGVTPQINADLSLKIKKFTIKPGTILMRGSNGEIFATAEDITKTTYEVINESDFVDSDALTENKTAPAETPGIVTEKQTKKVK